jgi:hypothetical protein
VVTQQGPFTKLNKVQGSVHDLMLEPQEEKGNSDSGEVSQPQHPIQRKLAQVDNIGKDKAKRIRDLSVYAFYFRSIGFTRGLVFLLTALLLVFSQRFSRKYRLSCFTKTTY